MMKAPPPRPEDWGSTSPSTACTATAASTADPPRRRTAIPASTASGLAAATNGPRAGRVAGVPAAWTGADAPPTVVVWQPASARVDDSARTATSNGRNGEFDMIIWEATRKHWRGQAPPPDLSPAVRLSKRPFYKALENRVAPGKTTR